MSGVRHLSLRRASRVAVQEVHRFRQGFVPIPWGVRELLGSRGSGKNRASGSSKTQPPPPPTPSRGHPNHSLRKGQMSHADDHSQLGNKKGPSSPAGQRRHQKGTRREMRLSLVASEKGRQRAAKAKPEEKRGGMQRRSLHRQERPKYRLPQVIHRPHHQVGPIADLRRLPHSLHPRQSRPRETQQNGCLAETSTPDTAPAASRHTPHLLHREPLQFFADLGEVQPLLDASPDRRFQGRPVRRLRRTEAIATALDGPSKVGKLRHAQPEVLCTAPVPLEVGGRSCSAQDSPHARVILEPELVTAACTRRPMKVHQNGGRGGKAGAGDDRKGRPGVIAHASAAIPSWK